MKKSQEIFRAGNHYWTVISRDPDKPNYLIDTNEYLVGDGTTVLMTDPGGMEIFPAVFSALCEADDPEKIKYLFASHQDPDIVSSLALWLSFNPDIKCYLSWLWGSFVPHFGGTDETFLNIPDEGMPIQVGRVALEAIPAHYLHSSGNFHLYDVKARILFSGDIGAAMLPASANDLFVKDFDSHIQHMKGFHQRWMGSKDAVMDWCTRASKLQIDMLCPQHGAIFQGQDVMRFINWLAELPVGSGMYSNRK
jgi:flavorubredoxin